MRKAKRGFGSGRLVWIALVAGCAAALAGCGDDESSSAGITVTKNDSGTNTPPAIADTGTTTTTTPPTTTTTPPTTTTTPPATTPPAATSSNVTLAWVPPTQNANGTPISGLAGYKIRYGTASESYTQTVALSNPSLSRYVVDSLTKGTYYFTITAYNTQGVESALSGEISTSLN